MRTVRTIVFWLHLALGCLAGLVILAMSVTGVLLAFERQINVWADAPAVLQSQSQTTAQAPLDSLLANLKNDGQGVPSELILHSSPKAPVEARFGRERTLYLNPWTGEIIGEPSKGTRTFFSSVERIHRSLGLGMQSAFGRGATGAANLAFLFMLLSGLYLWLPKAFNLANIKNRVLLRRALVGKAREWNWHHVVGIWTAFPLVFIVLTGVIMSYPWASNLLFTMTGSQKPASNWRGERPTEQSKATHPSGAIESSTPQFLDLEELAGIAKQHVPGWKSLTVELPQPTNSMLTVSVDKSVGGQPERSSQLILNRQTGRVQAIRSFSDNSAGRKLRAWARFTHTGEEFGVIGETIAAIASVGAVVLVWTGLSMAIRRAQSTQLVKTIFAKKAISLAHPDPGGALDSEASNP
jgi:uncharacterized iron-regulated membrane protein